MWAKALTLIVAFVHSLLVQGLSPEIQHNNSTTDLNRRVINGEAANPSDFLYLVRLFDGPRRCGGSIIGNYFILTAAHCVYGLECSEILIVASHLEGETIPTIYTSGCYMHPNFVETHYFYDIALIQTSNDMLEDGKLKAIPLPWPGTNYAPGTSGVIVGWGRKEDNNYPDHMLRGDVLVESWDTCNDKFREGRCRLEPNMCTAEDIPRRGLCTQGQGARPPSACFGDSGGPVVIDNEVAGVIVSSILVNGVCKRGTPTLSTNVVDYLPWIYSFTEPDRDTSSFPVVEESS